MNKLMTKRLTGQLSLHSRRPLMTNESGRSMVEMLGVLAIVGVLSAGALAGFNRAMMMHKLNKWTDSFNYFLDHALSFSINYSDTFNYDGDLSFEQTANELGLLGDGFTFRDGKIYDEFENLFEFYYVKNENFRIRYMLYNSDLSMRICEKFIYIAQQHVDNISRVYLYTRDGEPHEAFLKDRLKNANLSEIHEYCSSCTASLCYFYIFWQ